VLIRAMKTYSNIFKICGAAQLEVELIFSITPVYSSADSKLPQKKWFKYYKIWTGTIIVLKLKFPSNSGGSTFVWKPKKPLRCDT
jgi:hypothetical protein